MQNRGEEGSWRCKSGTKLVSRALAPYPPSLGTMQRGWLFVSFPNLYLLCFSSFGTYLVPPPRDPTSGFDHPDQAPLRRGESRGGQKSSPRGSTAQPRPAWAAQSTSQQHRAAAQSTSQAPERSSFLGKAGCKRDDSGQALLPSQTQQGPAAFPPCGDVSWGRPSGSGSWRQLQGAAPAPQPRFRKTPEVFSRSQKHLLGQPWLPGREG